MSSSLSRSLGARHSLAAIIASITPIAPIALAGCCLSLATAAPGAGAPECGPVVLSQSTSHVIDGGSSVVCFATWSLETSLARAFDVGAEGLSLQCVTFGVDTNKGGAVGVEVHILTGSATDGWSAFVERGSTVVDIPSGASGTLVTAALADAIDLAPFTRVLVELRTPSRDPNAGGDGGFIALGCNSLGESAPTYLRATMCGVDTFTPTADLGFGDSQLVLDVAGAPLPHLTKFGLGHAALGGATLSTVGNEIVIDGSGTKGPFGYSVLLGDAEGWHTDMNIESPQSVLATVKATVDGHEGQPVVHHTATAATDGYDIAVDFSPVGSTSNTWKFFFEGEQVGEVGGVGNGEPLKVRVYRLGNDFYYVDSCCPGEYDHISLSGKTILYFDFADGAELHVDRIDVYPDNPTVDPGPANAVDFLVSGVPEFRVWREQVQAFGQLHESLGDATLSPAMDGAIPGIVVGSVVGAPAGISTAFGGAASASSGVLFDTPIPVGATFDATAFGSVNGASSEIFTMHKDKVASGFVVSASFASIGASEMQVNVLSPEGTIVQSFVHIGGPVGFINTGPIGACTITMESYPLCTYDFGIPTFFTAPGQNPVVAGGLQFIPIAASSSVGGIDRIDLTGTGMSSFRLSSSSLTKGFPCPGDLNTDGTVDAADLAIMLGGWGNGGISDLDGNGTTDAADLGTLLGAWGSCGT